MPSKGITIKLLCELCLCLKQKEYVFMMKGNMHIKENRFNVHYANV